MPINSKQKGNRFEREVAKLFTKWSGCSFIRTPMSGAIHNFHDERVVSDIVVNMELLEKGWKYSIECKNVEWSWALDSLITGKELFWEHWKQANRDADREQSRPILIFTKNRKEIYVALYTRHLKTIIPRKLDTLPTIEIRSENYEPITIIQFKLLLEKSKVENWCK